VNPRDRVSLERIAKNVLPGVGASSVEKVFSFFDANPKMTLREAADVLSARAKVSLLRVANFIEQYQERTQETDLTKVFGAAGAEIMAGATALVSPEEIVEQAVKYFDFAHLVHSETPEGSERMQNLEVLASNASAYASIDEFLADAALLSSADESTDKNSVSLMTLHAAKGLEFPVVFIVGLEEGLFPSSRAGESEEDLEEERRLAYVGMTRAMKDLFLTFASSRYAFGGRNYNAPSQFLLELGYNPYGSGGFGESGAFDVEISNVDAGAPGVFGGDPDGEFSDFSSDLSSDFDPFPDDVPVFEG
jgi:DNA helicase-2/ATP-dependent DNA helicase PcrA